MVIFGSDGKNARLIGTAMLIFTFVAGALAGAAAIRVLSAKESGKARAHAPHAGGPMRGGPRRLLLDDQFAKELGLTNDQRTQIKTILDRRDTEAKAMWSKFEPQLKQFGKQVHDEIEKVLTPEQQKKLDTALEQRRSVKNKKNCAPDSARKI